VLVAPAYPSASTLPRSSSTPSHTYDAATLSKTRVWGSNEKILLHFSAVLLLSEKQHWGSAKCSCKIVVGSLVTYDYDAFGNLLHSTATGTPPGGTTAAPTPNEFLFAGEQFDSDLNLYYNRARYLNVSTGRFWTMDTYEGDPESPLSLHKYLFGQGDPVDLTDPTGHDILEVSFAVGISTVLGGISGATFTGTLKGFFLGAAGGGALGIACSAVELCGRSAVSGVLNLVFQVAANEYESYYDRVLGLPQPSAQKQREALVAAFASGAASPLVSLVVDPNDAARLAALQSAFNAAYKALLQGQTLQQAFVQGLGAAVISYVVQVGVGKDFGPQFYSPPVVDLIISNVRATISSTISTAINPIQEHILRLFPSVHRFVYGN
jgi:RHS repeat-associated protein